MFALPGGPRRWPIALRSAVCMGVPVLVGWLAGDLTAGLTATLGGFTGLYGSGRPYLDRAQLLVVTALAVVFITALALLIAAGGRRSTDLGALLFARGLDTTVGCAVAVAAFLLIVPTGIATWLPTAIADTLDAVDRTTAYLSPTAITMPAAGIARRDLQRSALRLMETFDNAVNGSTAQRKAAEQTWPAVAATQGLAYRTLAECWRLGRLAPDRDGNVPTEPELAELHRSLRAMAEAARAGREPPPIGAVPAQLSGEVHDVRDALARQPGNRRNS